MIWPKAFEKQRRVILGAGMMAVYGRILREGEVVHLIAQRLNDLSAALASAGDRDAVFPPPHGRGDEFHHGGPGLDPRGRKVKGPTPRDIYIPAPPIRSIKVAGNEGFPMMLAMGGALIRLWALALRM